MLNLCKTLSKLCRDPLALNFNNLQIVRWRRKPRWLPTAKSKVFRVAPKPAIDPDETLELKRLHDNYRSQVKAIRRFLVNRYFVGFVAKSDTQAHNKAIEEDWVHSNLINDEWNAQCKAVREKRCAMELQNELDYAKQRIAEEAKNKVEQLQMVERIVKQEKELSSTFITAANIDEAIEKALANPTSYNYAIDSEGNKYSDSDGDKLKKQKELKQ